jgi:type IX secretion system PorP/SprF family membrane protein
MEKYSNYKKIVITATVVIAFMSVIKAQDPHFSQYFSSPMTINPSLIGKDVEDWRLTSTLRRQWWGATVAPYNTYTASIDKRIAMSSTGDNQLGIGMMAFSDESNNGLLKDTYLSLGAAYNMTLDGTGQHHLGAGLTANYAGRLVDPSKFEFQSQFGSMGFQRSVPSNDPVTIQSYHYLEVNAGLNYSYDSKKWGCNLGAAVFHASRPKGGVYLNSTYTIDARYSIQGGLYFNLVNKNQILLSEISEMQGQNSLHSVGMVYKISVQGNTLRCLNVGLWERFGDATYPYIRLESERWIAGLTYDVVTTGVKTTSNSVQSMELSFAWQFFSAKHQPIPVKRIIQY